MSYGQQTLDGFDPSKDSSADPQEEVLNVAEEMPEFPGGHAALFRFIVEHINYPATAIDNGIEGKVLTRFTVGRDGIVTDIRVLQGIGGGCDEEARRVLSLMPTWTPGRQDGRNVNVKYQLPISFNLPPNSSKKNRKDNKKSNGH